MERKKRKLREWEENPVETGLEMGHLVHERSDEVEAPPTGHLDEEERDMYLGPNAPGE